ncbi:hypothetical protein CIG75_03225 [Tumebacillus algifaecis]|uniref:Uncharacterized protein n=1 Tax=Tumebacillus algifaecis TaxID=1214604 RepID=A0A223CY62_9BACL|nr:hypothetical protein [Tumebacillus algifaecis]ASS74094.1 hypothetical protein CIG75_03225 [Tumebacillus algifaecis]
MNRSATSRPARTRQEVEEYLRNPDNVLGADILEELANDLLAPILKDKSRTKSARQEYSILSPRQLERRWEREIVFTSLSKGAKVLLGLTVEDD